VRGFLIGAIGLLGLSVGLSSSSVLAQEDVGEAVVEIFGRLFFPEPAAPMLVQPAQETRVEMAPVVPNDGPAILDSQLDDGDIPADTDAADVQVQAQAGMMMINGLVQGNENDIDAQIKQMRAQFVQQYRPLLKTELHFVHKVCNPTDEQGKKLTAAGKKALDQAGQKMAEVQGKMMRGQFAVFPGNDVYPDPRKVIREGLTAAMTDTLSPEQIAAYKQEIEKRSEARKKTLVKYLVAKLDIELELTA